MKKEYSINKTCLHFLIFFILIALNFPLFHEHIDNHHEIAKHADNIAHHSLNDYSVNSHKTFSMKEFLPIESHHTHYHSHFEKDFYRTPRIDTNNVKTIYVYTFNSFNNPPTHSLALKRHSYDSYKPESCINNTAKTSSGLSPPIHLS